MATSAKKVATKAAAPAKKVTAKKAAAPAKAPVKAPVKAAVKAPAAKKVVAKKAAAKAPAALTPIKDSFTKASLATHIAEKTEVELKTVKAVLAQLESVILGSIHKKGAGEFTLPGLLKISATAVAAKKKRFGKDPFSGEERWFPAKPASVRVKARALKKLKDAAA